MTEVVADGSAGVRLSELMAVLSLSADLGLGQPMEHVLRSCLVAMRLAGRLELDDEQRAETYWVTLLAAVCTGESSELAQLFGDDIAFRAGTYAVGPTTLAQLGYLVRTAGATRPPLARARTVAGLVLTGGKAMETSFRAHAAVTAAVAEALGLGPGVRRGLGHAFAQWNGKGVPDDVAGEDIAVSARLMRLADLADVHLRTGGIDRACAAVRRHAGTLLDPGLAELFCANAAELVSGIDDDTTWDALVMAEPAPRAPLTEMEFDGVLEVLADVADLKAPCFSGHSRGVALLAARAANVAGLPAREVTTLRRAALVHDLGRTGVSTAIWDKPGPLTAPERERVRLHAYYTERMLRPAALAGLAAVAASGHERLDGSGYHRALAGQTVPQLGRLLAAADAYHAMREDRPYRPALTAAAASEELRAAVRAGELDGAAVDAVLTAAGHRRTARKAAPAGLTARELEVLALVARGSSTRDVARTLAIAPKTAGNHIERIYQKIGVSSRSSATLFAMRHGLVETWETAGS